MDGLDWIGWYPGGRGYRAPYGAKNTTIHCKGMVDLIPWQFPSADFPFGKQFPLCALYPFYILDLHLNTQVNLSKVNTKC